MKKVHHKCFFSNLKSKNFLRWPNVLAGTSQKTVTRKIKASHGTVLKNFIWIWIMLNKKHSSGGILKKCIESISSISISNTITYPFTCLWHSLLLFFLQKRYYLTSKNLMHSNISIYGGYRCYAHMLLFQDYWFSSWIVLKD